VELEGKVAIVTGASRGIGRAIAEELARGGARVVVNYRTSAAEAEALAESIGGLAVQADVSTTAGCEHLVAAAEELGGVDLLVNNAGITSDGLAMRMKDAQWDEVLRTNAGGTFRMCRAVLPTLARKRDGAIVNIGSVAAVRGSAGQANYSASKAAVVALTKALALEMARRNVRINAVCPGFIDTDMTRDLTDAQKETALGSIPMRRMGQPHEIAPVVRFLCGPGALYVTGQVWLIDGGLSA
jgi:3-oxoacyl-[acyl-carrier protein] reductase